MGNKIKYKKDGIIQGIALGWKKGGLGRGDGRIGVEKRKGTKNKMDVGEGSTSVQRGKNGIK